MAQQLEDVDEAIEAIEGGAQSITAEDGRTYTRADLGTLYKRADRLESRANRASGGDRRVAEF